MAVRWCVERRKTVPDGVQKSRASDLLRKGLLDAVELAAVFPAYLEKQSALHEEHAYRLLKPFYWAGSCGVVV